MLNLLFGIIAFYIIFRLLITLIIPKITQYRINKYQEKFKQENKKLFKNQEKGYTGNIHPSLKKYYENDIKIKNDIK